MERMTMEDPRVAEISEEWVAFIDKTFEDFPDNATALSLGQFYLYLLMEYQPPIDELLQVLEVVINQYAKVIGGGDYKAKMN